MSTRRQNIADVNSEGINFAPNNNNEDQSFYNNSSSYTSTASFSKQETGKNKTRPEKCKNTESYQKFRKICDDIIYEIKNLIISCNDNTLPEDWTTASAEIEALIESLYHVQWGTNDSIKRITLKIQAQVYNTKWDIRHLDFLLDTFTELRNSYSIDDSIVASISKLVLHHRLPPFRGTLTSDEPIKKYKLIEVSE
jgi:hypothetical protein